MTAWTLMTAMPPTKGHEHLIQFTAALSPKAKVILVAQPHEPMGLERWDAINRICNDAGAQPIIAAYTVNEDPDSEGFWEYWRDFMYRHGFQPGDIFVSSETYGQQLADICKGVFIPYDPARELYPIKATAVRDNPLEHFADISTYFQWNLRTTITVFGAESTGKTTLSKELAGLLNGHWLWEWARPYLETVGPEITKESMHAIWKGQLAAQRHTYCWHDKPFVIQDTDLFSTVGYWQQPHWESDLGPCPDQLIADAVVTKSDLYIITKSNIPFEQDPIRYGGDHRESPDEYWIGVADTFGLNYVVLEDPEFSKRVGIAMDAATKTAKKKMSKIYFDRHGR